MPSTHLDKNGGTSTRKSEARLFSEQNTTFDPDGEKYRECIDRMERSRRTGRVTIGVPDFVGVWRQSSPWKEDGAFEIFIKKKNGNSIEGRIEDIYGTASFFGEIIGDVVTFTKCYTDRLTLAAAQGNIVYSGKKEGSRFVGTYIGEHTDLGHFEMSEPLVDALRA